MVAVGREPLLSSATLIDVSVNTIEPNCWQVNNRGCVMFVLLTPCSQDTTYAGLQRLSCFVNAVRAQSEN
jgi:hypothetical protein